MKVGDLVEFKNGSVGIKKGSLGLVVAVLEQKTMEPGRWNYLLYDVQTLDGQVRRFSDGYIKKVTPGLYST